MEESSMKTPFLFSVFIFLVFSPNTHSRPLSSSSQIFHVSPSIQNALQILSRSPQPAQQQDFMELQTALIDSARPISVPLHPRSSLAKPQYTNYSSLTLARIARDSARVDSLYTKLELALSNLTLNAARPEELEAPITSGVSQGSGEYFTRVGVGRPAKEYYMAIDTGSDVTWLQCQPCTDCYSQSDPIYNPSDSSTFARVACGSGQCAALQTSVCRRDTCLYQVVYGDGSFTVGDLVTETLSFGRSGSVPGVAIGCGHDNEGLFVGSAGLLGLGGGALSLPKQLKATSFSYCLVDRDSGSSSTLEFNSARPADSVTAPLLQNSKFDTFFYVQLTGISVGGKLLSIPPSIFAVEGGGDGGVIVDSGTAVTRLRTQAYEPMRDAFASMTQHLPSGGKFVLFDTCYDLSSMSRVSVPTVAFHFPGGKTLPLHPKNYLIPVDSVGKFCFAFAPTSGALSIIGNVQQQGMRVSYDLANKVVGFSPDKC